MFPSFRDRRDAGRRLAEALRAHAGRSDVVVLGLPRGGVPVAYEVALALDAPLDVFVVRKLGVPGQEELAMGAIASGGVRVLNEDVVDRLGIPPGVIEAAAAREARELERREQRFRPGREPLKLHGKRVILVDDGLATGATMLAAVRAVKLRGAERVVVAVPIASLQACRTMQREADECLCLLTPVDFFAVGQAYDDFTQTQDGEVCTLLHAAHTRKIERADAPAGDEESAPHPRWR